MAIDGADKSILITGCSSGIGRCAAAGLHKAGWRVFATARKSDDLRSLGDAGVKPLYLDYCEPDSIAAAADMVLEATGGRLYALFNNGAYGQPGAVEDVRPEVLRIQFETNFFGWHDLTHRLIPSMRAAGRGRIVQCSSCLGLVSLKYRGAYNASKFALEALTDAMRRELKGSGLHVSLIEPGPIATRFTETALAAYKSNIDLESSPHAEVYRARIARLEESGSNLFTAGPEAVLKKLVHALESRRPKARYYVTLPTYGLALARLLPTGLQDLVLGEA